MKYYLDKIQGRMDALRNERLFRVSTSESTGQSRRGPDCGRAKGIDRGVREPPRNPGAGSPGQPSSLCIGSPKVCTLKISVHQKYTDERGNCGPSLNPPRLQNRTEVIRNARASGHLAEANGNPLWRERAPSWASNYFYNFSNTMSNMQTKADRLET